MSMPDPQLEATRPALAVLVDSDGAFMFTARGDADRQGFLHSIRDEATIRCELAELHWVAVLAGAEPLAGVPAPDEALLGRLESTFGGHGSVEPMLPSAPVGPGLGPVEADPETSYVLFHPVALRVSRVGFDHVDHDGIVRIRLDPRQLAAATSFALPRLPEAAYEDQRTRLGDQALPREAFDDLLRRLLGSRLLLPLDQNERNAAEGRSIREFRHNVMHLQRREESVARHLDQMARDEQEREARTGVVRTKVVPVNSEGIPLPSLGLPMAYAKVFDGGRLEQSYQFLPDWGDHTVPSLTGDEPPAIYLFSNYIWSHAWNVERSAEVKAKSPQSITVHGGPNTPKYGADIETYFAMNPHVDVAVHGEGEVTFAALLDALEGQLGDGPPDLSVLADVAGVTFRDGDRIVSAPKRDRLSDLDVLPSPYLTGLFDSIGDSEINLMTVETMRGCPYGCTFCDWGSATQSRMRKFDLQRVYDELEWCARNKVEIVFCADSNFGIFARDVDIARKVVELKQQYGYPKRWESSYAKNTVKHLREIVQTMAAGGVLSTGTLSLQSMDPGTLDTIARSNIRVDKYDELADEFGSNDLPLMIELMMGLPGSTLESFVEDLQQCIDREVKARVNPTEVLMNSPMNNPDYREANRIETLRPVIDDWSEKNSTRKKALVVSTATFSRTEYDEMEAYRRLFVMCENFGVLRHVSRFVRQESALREMDFYWRLAADASANRSRWPTIAFTFEAITECMIPPVSWRFFIDELRDYLLTQLEMAPSSGLETVLRVQHALLPAGDRTFPAHFELDHDYVAWYHAMLEVKRQGNRRDWPSEVPPLEQFGPGSLDVDDPQSLSAVGMGMAIFFDSDADWELGSPVARVMQYRHAIHV